jgi:hypothetical protein
MLLVRRPLRALLTDSRNGSDHARQARQEQGGGDNARDVSVIPRLSSGEDHHGQDASHHQHANGDGTALDSLQDMDGVVSHGRPPSTSDVFSDDGREPFGNVWMTKRNGLRPAVRRCSAAAGKRLLHAFGEALAE